MLIRLERTVEEGSAIGYVAGVGAEWFLLQVVADDINFDGYQAMRIADLSEFELAVVGGQRALVKWRVVSLPVVVLDLKIAVLQQTLGNHQVVRLVTLGRLRRRLAGEPTNDD